MSTAALNLDRLIVNGTDAKRTHAVLTEASTGVTMTETITGASTVEVNVQDVDRTLLRSPLLGGRSTLVLDGAGFELAAVNKTGSGLRLTFEDIAVARLRTHTAFRKIAAGHMSRAEFIRDLVHRDERWIDVHTVPGPNAKVELSRGTAKGPRGGQAKPEDTWAAAGRIMGEIGWRVFARRGDLWLVPDSHLIKQTPYRLTEDSDGVDNIDLDFDIGKPAATATITVRAGFRTLPAGSAVHLADMGPGNGAWIVESITRTVASKTASVKLLRPQPILPEPEDTSAGAGEPGEGGWTNRYLPGDADLETGAAAFGPAEDFVKLALAQRGKPYVWGASGPGSFDCSGLVQYCAHRLGYRDVSKPAVLLYGYCRRKGKSISVAQGIATRGALLFRLNSGATNHVAISLGNGKTIEAMGKAYGVRIGSTKGRFDHAGLLPGISYRPPGRGMRGPV